MLVYHYSTTPHKELKTKAKQKKPTSLELKQAYEGFQKHKKLFKVEQPGFYYDHISFFIDPIPLNIAKYFPKTHAVWVKGNTIYEHIVELTDSDSFGYEIVEFPERIELYYDQEVSDEEFFERVSKMLKSGYIGRDLKGLETMVNSKGLKDVTEDFFKKLPARPNYKNICEKYAATVPHLMLYPDDGIFVPKSVRELKLL